jgi:glycosyltransferase involved in cell wall biosynthesis
LKVLILTYYWPPSGGSGVQRWLKFVKYLQDFGITPVVYTVDNPDYPIEDKTLENDIPQGVEVLRQPIWEPYKLAGFFSRSKAKKTSAGFLSQKQSLLGKTATYIRANYFIPDARMFWIKPSVKYLEDYLKKNPVDIIISSGPPHSLHLIAKELKDKTGIKWVSDFRDPWTDIDYFHQLPLSEKAKKKHFRLEKQVLENSDAVLVVGKTMQENYLPFNSNTYVISNGFDIEIKEAEKNLDKKFSITHIGMMNEDRNPKTLWKVLAELKSEIIGFGENLEIQLIGKLAGVVLVDLESENLSDQINHIDYLPHHEVQDYQRKSQVLLLAVNRVPSAKGIITGKIFEYLVAKRPILAIGPEDGDLAEIIEKSKAGNIVGFDEHDKLKSVIVKLYTSYLKNELSISSEGIEQYHRKNITKQLSKLLKTVV